MSSHRWPKLPLRRTITAVVCSLAAVAFVTPTALAAGPIAWHGRILVDGPDGTHRLRAVACTTPHFCVAVDDAGNAVRSNTPAAGAAAWKRDQSIDGTNQLTAVGCAPTLCVAGDRLGNVLTLTNPASSASHWTTPESIDANSITGIACPTAALCVAVDFAGQVHTSTAPTGGPSKWTGVDADPGNILTAVSCPSTSFCAAVDRKGNSLTSVNPAAGTWTLHTGIDGTNDLESVSCATRSLCAATDEPSTGGNVLTSTTPTAAGAWKARNVVPAGQFNTLFGVACPLKNLCTAVDDAGNAITSTNPTAGAAAWKLGQIDGRWGFYGVSCTKTVLCAAADAGGNVVVGKLAIAGTQLTSATINHVKHSASFGFRAIGIASGFQCSLKKKGLPPTFASCASPKHYANLVAGRTYTFLVRAVNSSGVDPTPAGKSFTP